MVKKHSAAWCALLLTAAAGQSTYGQSAVGEASEFTNLALLDVHAEWRLPSRLREVSGLAMTPDQRLLAVDDEKAIVYQIDYVDGRLRKAFALGKPVLRGDFEGLAVVGDTIYLLTSGGVIYAAAEGDDGDRVEFEVFDSGLEEQCEFEGLAYDSARANLLLLCKDVLDTADIDALSIFAWNLNDRQVVYDQRIELPMAAISSRLNRRRLHPSGIAVHPDTGSLLIVAARERALFEIDSEGALLNAALLPGERRHPQAEGIVVSSGGQLIIADEGGKGRARLTVYTVGER